MNSSRFHVDPVNRDTVTDSTMWTAAGELLRQQREEPPLVPQLHQRLIPLSFAQERLWVACQTEAGQAAYNIPFAWRLRGDLSSAALRDALHAVMRRHTIFHTVFGHTEGRPFQSVVNAVPVDLHLRDLSSIPEATQYSTLRDWMSRQAAEPFNLEQLPLVRASLARLSNREHVLLLVFHHIVFDAWSRAVFFRDLRAQYAASLTGTPSALPAPTLQYADYAVWDRKRVESVLEVQLEFWRSHLRGPLPALDLPLDRGRPALPSFRGGMHYFVLPATFCAVLDRFRTELRTTRFAVLLAAYYALLHRYTEQEDIIVGTASANRHRSDIRGMIGFFVNTVPLRAKPRAGMSFRELVRHVQQTIIDAFMHQDVPLERIVEAVRPARTSAGRALFDTMFVLQNASRTELDLPGLQSCPVRIHNRTSKFDLTFELREVAGAITGAVEFSTDLFDAATVRWLARHYQQLLQSALQKPDVALASLDLVTPRERRQLMEANATAAPFPRDLAVPSVFEQVVAAKPDAVAIEDSDDIWTYNRLEKAANALAHQLVNLGVTPNTPVGIFAERSPRMIMAMLAVLKAGGAYVPLDPSYPRERIEFMINDTAPRVLLADRKLKDGLPQCSAQVVMLDHELPETTRRPNVANSGEDTAYLLYTSGSTGKPKGVAVPHRAINRLVLNTNYVQITQDDVIAQAANSSFDAATFEIWGALLNGARTVLIRRDTLLSPAAFASELRQRRVSILFLTTALFNLMARDVPGAFSSLKCLLFGGESADVSAVRSVLRHAPPQKLLNVYGPTETTTFATWYDVSALSAKATSVPIGIPIANTEVHLLDRAGAPAPIGTRGEIFIGGDGVALGYWRRPELTAERFITRSVPAVEGSRVIRLYRTGDYGRRLPDGNIEFLGRADSQVKIRGFRVELAEIESALSRLPRVRQAHVRLYENDGEKRLAAYVSPAAGEKLNGRDLRRALGSSLPDYMIPAAITVLPELPINANGKVDITALPKPGKGIKADPDTVKPWIPLQVQLAQVWSEVLSNARDTTSTPALKVGLRDNFFDLGGHSLLAVRLVERIEEICGVRLPVSTLFTASTVEQLSDLILRQQFGAAKPIIEIQPRGERVPIFFLHGDLLGGGLYCLNLARQLGSDQPFFALPPNPMNDTRVPSIEEMAAEHLRAVRAHTPHGPYVLGGFCIAGLIALEMARQLEADGEAVPLLIMADPPVPSFLRHSRRWIERTGALSGHNQDRQLERLHTAFNRLYRFREFCAAPAQARLRLLADRLHKRTPGAEQTTSEPASQRDLQAAYLWSAAGFRPVSYHGHSVLFLCDSVVVPLSVRVNAWKRLLPKASMRIMPGEHLDLVTTYSGELAAGLRVPIDELQPDWDGAS